MGAVRLGWLFVCLAAAGCGEPGSGWIGDPCRTRTDCRDDDCLDAWPGGYCVAACRSDGGCPAGTVCREVEPAAPVCLARCRTVGDCRAGYACISDACTAPPWQVADGDGGESEPDPDG